MSDGWGGSDIDPLAVLKDQIIEKIRDEIGDTWRRDDQFLTKFFPVQPTAYSNFSKVRAKLYNDKVTQKRWQNVPSKPMSLSRLYTPLRMLMNNILRHHGILLRNRVFLDTHTRKKSVRTIPRSPISPTLFLAGIGDEFANTSADRPGPFAQCGIASVEVIFESDDLMAARDRLAVNIHQMFQNQDNRRFAYGLIITETMLTAYMFDHSGAVASAPFNYHQHPEQFCAVIVGLASDKASRLGFDRSIFSKGASARICTYEPTNDGSLVATHYTIKESLFQFPSLVGRGTICWLTSGPNDSGSTFVVKDAWIAPSELAGRESEGSLLRHVRARGIVNGVVQIHHFEEVRLGADASDLDTVLRNRRDDGSSPDNRTLDRVHTRIVMETHGKTLDQFATRKELLLAFHDAVLAHRKLHDVAGILHRDISVRNILINSKGVEGDRGILIDFDHAIRVGDSSPYSAKKKIGTWRYMSRNVLDGTGPHTYFDDLESFYYVLCYILAAYERPGIEKAERPELLMLWDHPGSSDFKQGLFNRHFRLPVAPWFGRSLHRLAERLHQFFDFHLQSVGRPLSSLDPDKDYDELLSLIGQGIADLEKEPELLEDTPSSGHSTSKPDEPCHNPASAASGDRRPPKYHHPFEPKSTGNPPPWPHDCASNPEGLVSQKRPLEDPDTLEELDAPKRHRGLSESRRDRLTGRRPES